MAKRDLSVFTIRECLCYDPKTGVFTRAKRTAQCHQVGDRADLPAYGNLFGYRTIGLQGDKHLAHRVAWAHFYGEWPGKMIDHINGDKGDNRIANLRDVSAQTNLQNRRNCMPSNVSGLLGAVWNPPTKTWRARIQIGKKFIQLGMFDTALEAHNAYVQAKRIYHAGCTI